MKKYTGKDISVVSIGFDKEDQQGVNNILVCGPETVCIYDETQRLTEEDVRKWCALCHVEYDDICMGVAQDQLQYYCIDSRLWLNEEKYQNLMRKIA